jgi:hypothetical protein
MSGRLRLRPWPGFIGYRFVPLRQVQARPTHCNSELSLCSAGGHSYVASPEVFRDELVRSGAQYQRDTCQGGATSKNFSSGHTGRGWDNIAPIRLYIISVRPLKINRFSSLTSHLFSMSVPQSTQSCNLCFLAYIHSVMRVKLVLAGEGGGCTPTPLSLHLPSPVKLQCTLQLSGQTH